LAEPHRFHKQQRVLYTSKRLRPEETAAGAGADIEWYAAETSSSSASALSPPPSADDAAQDRPLKRPPPGADIAW